MTPRAVFVAGTHTDVGKTYAACALILAARARGLEVAALKPVVSGLDPADWALSDPGRLLAALGRPLDAAGLEGVSPWRFRAPLAPPMAAAREGRALSLNAISELCRRRLAEVAADLLVIEGAGGLMSPIADDGTGLDLMCALQVPSLLVCGAYLGAISHALTAVEVLRARGMPPRALVLNEGASHGGPGFEETASALARFANLPIIRLRRHADSGEAILAAVLA